MEASSADSGYESEKNSQSTYRQYLERIEHFYDNEIRTETRLVNEVGYDFPLHISTGYSAARNVLPVNADNDNKSFSLMDLDWYELTFNSGLQPVESAPAHMESMNFKLISFPSVMKRRILKLESYGVEIYLEADWLVELSKFIPLITSRLELLKSSDFANYYNNMLLCINSQPYNDCKFDVIIRNLCSLDNTVKSYCMLEFLSFNDDEILKDISCLMF
ncbi:hypothetical protein JTB14_001974 [Gonioctena quinquepunctata]|nr:hypothetical protein JTB14_001974 [Gonioctena quinquepunctata]